jgi:hypothetical protein
MDITLSHSAHTFPVQSTVAASTRKKYHDPGLAVAIGQMLFVLTAEVALVVLLLTS